MGIRLKKIYIKNFKVYNEQSFDLNEIGLLVLDGPNGFGKTTIYDAIELLFTNQIKRYERLASLYDRRETKEENPLYNVDGTDGVIIIKVLFSFDGTDYILATKNSKANEPVINFNHFQLHRLLDFEEEVNGSNETDDSLLIELLGENYKRDFEFINYVEQEDTFYYLKSSEKNKKESIGYLFNTQEFNAKIDKYKRIDESIKGLLKGDNGVEFKISGLSEAIKEVEKSFKKVDNSSYNQLFEAKDFEWDNIEIDFEKISYNEIFNIEESILTRLESLVLYKSDFLNFLFNKKIDNLLRNEQVLEKFYYYEGYRDIEEKLFEEFQFVKAIIEFKGLFEEFQIDDVLEKDFGIPSAITKSHDENVVFKKYKMILRHLKIDLINANSAEKIYSRIISTRDSLESHLSDYHKEINNDGICPLCGHDFESSELLIKNIEEQKSEIQLLNSSLNKKLTEDTESVLNFVRQDLFIELDSFVKDFSYNADYFNSDFFHSETKSLLNNVRENFQKLEIDYSDNISVEIMKNDLGFEKFKKLIIEIKRKYKEENIKYYFQESFEYFFSSSLELLNAISLEEIEVKKQYINWKYSMFQSDVLNLKREELAILIDKKTKLSKSQVKIKDIIYSLQNSLNHYNSQLIKDIELLFHIYSGRIVQDFQGGLGLFVIDRGDKIKFVTSPEKTFDAIFSMSTGQLSALILSFTLALNKKYSKTKLLLIDDPVQSMDDINTAGFIEVLRNDFADRQILLSTHEQMLSTYIRYKFKKFNIDSLRIDLSQTNNIADA